MNNNEPNNNRIANLDTILGVVKEEYSQSERKHGTLISKVQTLMTITTIIFGLISGLLLTANHSVRSETLNYVSLGFILSSILCCIWALRSRSFHRVKYSPALEENELNTDPQVVKRRIIGSYDDAIKGSEPNYETLSNFIDGAIVLLVVSIFFGVLTVSFLPSKNIKEIKMSNENQSNNQSNNTNNNNSNQTSNNNQSYGTEVHRRDYGNSNNQNSYGTRELRESVEKKNK